MTTSVQHRQSSVRRAPLPVFTKVFTDSWRSLIGWALGLAAAAMLYLPLFPSMSGDSGMQQLIDNLPPELTRTINYDQIGTGAGYPVRSDRVSADKHRLDQRGRGCAWWR